MILLVDDDEDLRKLFSSKIHRATSQEVLVAGSVQEALKFLDMDIKIDLIISDYNMPHQNGVQFLETITSSDKSPYFILFTHSLEKLRIPAYERFLGMIDKSNFEKLLSKIVKVIKEKEVETEN